MKTLSECLKECFQEHESTQYISIAECLIDKTKDKNCQAPENNNNENTALIRDDLFFIRSALIPILESNNYNAYELLVDTVESLKNLLVPFQENTNTTYISTNSYSTSSSSCFGNGNMFTSSSSDI